MASDTRKQLNVRLPADLHHALAEHAVRERQTATEIVTEGIRHVLGLNGNGQPAEVTREEFEALVADVGEIKRVAQEAGAL